MLDYCRILLFMAFLPIVISCARSVNVDIVIYRVNIVDVEAGRIIPNQDLAIVGNTIQAISEHGLVQYQAKDSVDGTGKYVLPGLWDMHTHFRSNQASAFLPLFVIHGVTSIRDLGLTDPKLVRSLQSQVKAGELIGPRIYSSLAILEGESALFSQSLKIKSMDHGKAEIDQLIQDGAELVKLFHTLSPDVFRRIVTYSKERGLPSAGHLPDTVTAEEASNLGLGSIEHLWGTADQLDAAEKFDQLAETLKKNGTFQCPTIVSRKIDWSSPAFLDHGFMGKNNLRSDPNLDYVPPHLRTWWDSILEKQKSENVEDLQTTLRGRLKAIKILSQKGVKILAGTDTPNAFVIPGISLHEELEWLSLSGMKNLEVLRAATLYPSQYFKMGDRIGMVKSGYLADLVMTEENPLVDIKALRTISHVFTQSKIYRKADLIKLKSDVKKAVLNPEMKFSK